MKVSMRLNAEVENVVFEPESMSEAFALGAVVSQAQGPGWKMMNNPVDNSLQMLIPWRKLLEMASLPPQK